MGGGESDERLGLDESNPSPGPPAVLSEEAERERKRNQAKVARMQVHPYAHYMLPYRPSSVRCWIPCLPQSALSYPF